MFEWFDFSAVMNSIIGSLFVGALLLSAAPIWIKWLQPRDFSTFRKIAEVMAIPTILIGLLLLSVTILGYLERSSIPSYHPDFSDEEAARAYAECEMESIEATSEIRSEISRDHQRMNYRAACLIRKGFKWERGDAD